MLPFYKYDGAGNDFVILDIRNANPDLSPSTVAHLCHRRFGIGADGLMTLDVAPQPWHFKMDYYNSDGLLGSMCGNGGRCIAAFAASLGLGVVDPKTGQRSLDFLAFDGPHHAEIVLWDDVASFGIVRLGMKDVAGDSIRRCLDGWFLDTGSPHYVQRVQDLEHFDVFTQGRRIRNIQEQFPEGTNVDFIEDLPDGRLMVRTYERGVEDETWACGTGVTAASIVSGNRNLLTKGGDFKVDFTTNGSSYSNIRLTGPVSFNFKGEIEISDKV